MENNKMKKKRIIKRKQKPPSSWNACDPTDEIGDQLVRECKLAKEGVEKKRKRLWIHQTYLAMCECEDTFYTHMGILYDFIKIMDDSTDDYISKENIKKLHKLSSYTSCEVCLFPYEL